MIDYEIFKAAFGIYLGLIIGMLLMPTKALSASG